MNELRDLISTRSFLSSVTLPLAMMSFAIALLIAAFAPPNVNGAARAYYQVSIALVAFRVWYAASYEQGKVVWWGNLIWLNLLIATTMLAGAVILASSRGRAQERREVAEQDDPIGGDGYAELVYENKLLMAVIRDAGLGIPVMDSGDGQTDRRVTR